MEQIKLAALGLVLGLALTIWFVARNLVARFVLEPWKNRRPASLAIALPGHAHRAAH